MTKRSPSGITLFLFILISVLFLFSSVYTIVFDRTQVYCSREQRTFETLSNVDAELIESTAAPVGVCQQYRIPINHVESGDTSLIFYTVHQLVQVEMDGETIYTLAPASHSIGKSPGSNWVVIPIYPADSGHTLTVTITPVYESVVQNHISFALGSKYAYFIDRLLADLSQLLLSGLCILSGLVVVLVQMRMRYVKKVFTLDNIYLGIFSILLGIWRTADIRITSVLFASHTQALGYITVSSLFIMPVPILLFFCEICSEKRRTMINCAALASGAVALAALVLQAARVCDIRELLPLSHITLIADIAVVFIAVNVFPPETRKERTLRLFSITMALSCILDIAIFYFLKNSTGLTITLIMFLACEFYKFTVSIIDVTNMAYYDSNTRLYNRSRWIEVLENDVSPDETIGIIMFDLNCLKYVNDTLGHKIGDRLIHNFAGILHNNILSDDLLCRWGGDEFVVLVRNASRTRIDAYLSSIRDSIAHFNQGTIEFQIYYAWGFAISSDYPDLDRNELLTKADEWMYANKHHWYEEHSLTNHSTQDPDC